MCITSNVSAARCVAGSYCPGTSSLYGTMNCCVGQIMVWLWSADLAAALLVRETSAAEDYIWQVSKAQLQSTDYRHIRHNQVFYLAIG